MTSGPVISVALATYNGAAHLREQLDSIFTPCSVVYEVVAADDGSTDGTREILGEYARKRGLRDVSDGQHRGLVKNFEHVLRHCRGDYVALCDQDDVWLPGRLDGLLREIGHADAVYSILDKILLQDGTITTWAAPPGFREFVARHGDGRPIHHLIASNWVVSHTMLLKTAAAQVALPIPEGQPYHDAWLALAAAARGGIRHLPVNQTLYRQHLASHTAVVTAPSNRRLCGVRLGISRTDWRNKCLGEIGRLEACARAPFLTMEERAFAERLRCYYERGLKGGLSLNTGFSAMKHVKYFQFSASRRMRWNFVLRGFLGAV